MMIARLLPVLLVVLLSGCASQTIEPTYYLLRSDQPLPSGALQPSTTFSLGTVEIAPYLDQAGVVLETTDGQPRPASHHLWAEPVFDGVRNFLTTEIAQAKGQELLPKPLSDATTAVNIRIDQLHGTGDGNARIVAYWWLTRADKVLSLNRFSDTQPLAASGYQALVDAEKSLLVQLARNIAASLVDIPDQPIAE